MSEHNIQVKIIQYLRTFYPEMIVHSIPNGANVSAKNRLYLHNEGLLKGVPDLFIAEALNGFNGLYIELKSYTGKESDNQKIIRERLINKGYLVYVSHDYHDAINLIENYINGVDYE
jgi:hypothetical protein